MRLRPHSISSMSSLQVSATSAGTHDPGVWIAAQGAMATDLATFQASRPTTATWKLQDVLSAMGPALQQGFAWSLKQVESQLTVVVMHRSGWDLQSSVESQAADDELVGRMLANLMGIRLAANVATAQPHLAIAGGEHSASPLKVSAAEETTAAEPDFADGINEFEEVDKASVLSDPLSAADISTCQAMLKALSTDARKSFTIAFRSHFQVPREERTISQFITDQRHKQFIQAFMDELELQERTL